VTLVEICVDDVAGARIAERCGADRIEVCSDLLEGGITPSIGLVAMTLSTLTRIAVHVLVRPRGGDFVYDREEVEVMCADIEAIKTVPRGVDLGFVLSGLTPEGETDRAVMGILLDACAGAPATFSRAFDAVADQPRALNVLAELGVARVLTAGGPGTAAEGSDALATLVRAAGDRIGVLAGGGVRSSNVAELVAATGVREVHLRAPQWVAGRSRTSAAEISAVISAASSVTAR
jgi:copper homeostasis protein